MTQFARCRTARTSFVQLSRWTELIEQGHDASQDEIVGIRPGLLMFSIRVLDISFSADVTNQMVRRRERNMQQYLS